MDAFVSVLQFIGDEILNVPAYLIGIIVAIGLMILTFVVIARFSRDKEDDPVTAEASHTDTHIG